MSGSSGARSYSFRISAEGMGEFVRDLQRAAGESSAANAAIEALVRSSPQLASALSTSQQQVDAMAKRAAELREQTDRAADAARTMGEQQQRLSERLGGMESRAQATRRAVGDLAGAMELLGQGGVAERLGPVAGFIGNFADLFGTASLAAGRFEGATGALSARLAALAGVAAVPIFLQSVGLGINAAGQAADSAAGTMEKWRETLLRLNPALEDTARKAAEAADALRRQGLAALETGYGRILDRRGAIIGETSDLDRRIAAGEAAFGTAREGAEAAAAAARAAESAQAGAAIPGLLANRVATARAASQAAALRAEEAERALAELRERRARLAQEFAGYDRERDQFDAARRRIEIGGELYGPPAPPAPAAGGGRAAPARPQLPDPFATIYEAGEGTVFPAAAIEPPLRAMRERAEREAQQLSERLAREADRQATANERRFDSLTERFSDRLTDGIVNAFNAGAMRGENLFASLASGFGTILRAALAQSLSAGLVQPGVSAVLSGIGYTGAESGPGSMLSSVGSLTGLSGLLPAGGMAGMAEAIGLTSGNSLFGIGTTHSFALNPVALSSVLAAAGLGALGGGVLASVTGGNAMGGSLGGGLGAGAGFALASAGLLGPVGPVLAAVLGGAGGGLIGGLFGGGSERNVDFGVTVGAPGGRFAITGADEKWAPDQLRALQDQTAAQIAQLNALLDAAGVTVSGDAMIGQGGHGKAGASLDEAFARFRFSATDPRVNGVLAGRSFASSSDLAGAVQEVQGFIAVLDGFAQAAGDAADPLAAIRRQFEGLRATAERLGFGLDEVNRQQQRALDVARLQGEQAALSAGLRQSRILSDFLAGRDLATGSPASQLEAAQGQFGAAVATARSAGGQGADLSRVTSSAEALLRANTAFNATGPAASALEAWVRTTLQSLGRDLDLPGFAADPAAAVERWGRAQVDQLAALNTAVAGMREELQQIRLLQQRAA